MTPVDYLLSELRNTDNPTATRIDAAAMVAPYIHPRRVALN
jgi:hypothetical protein